MYSQYEHRLELGFLTMIRVDSRCVAIELKFKDLKSFNFSFFLVSFRIVNTHSVANLRVCRTLLVNSLSPLLTLSYLQCPSLELVMK